jgi:Protease subunit of ATP-dependent Clp proteases
MKKRWYQLSKIDQNTTEIYVYGDIEDYKWIESDVTAYDFAQDLSNIETQNINIRINSYGGSVASGLAIYNLLKSSNKNITTINDGFACSAASIIFMAGKERIMPKTSLLMIHNASSFASGNANDFRKIADDLEIITQPSIEAYKTVSNLSEDEIKKMMDNESWITADQAIEFGFATKVIEQSIVHQNVNSEFYLRNSIMKNLNLTAENAKLKEKINELNKKTTEQKSSDSWEDFF